MVARRDEHRRAAAHLEGLDREGERVRVHPLHVEQVAGQQDGVDAALHREPHRQLERAALVAAAVGATLGGQAAEGAAEVEIGNLEEPYDGHAKERSWPGLAWRGVEAPAAAPAGAPTAYPPGTHALRGSGGSVGFGAGANLSGSPQAGNELKRPRAPSTMPGEDPVPEPIPFPVPPVPEIERRLKWRALPVLAFLGLMLALAAVAGFSLLAPPRPLTGLPEDPDVAAARALVAGRLGFMTGELRFRSALTGEPAAVSDPAADAALAGRAAALLERARERHPRDGRLAVALAHLDLARRRYARAERGYRDVIERGVHSAEAHLGLGVTLALEAAAEPDPLRERGLRLEAIAQLAAVRPEDAVYDAALYDRALLLARVGRRDEAQRRADEFAAREPGSAWVEKLREAVEMKRR